MRPALCAATLTTALLAGGCGSSSLAPPVDAGASDAADAASALDVAHVVTDAACTCGIVGQMAPLGVCSFSVPCPEGDFFHLELYSSAGTAIPKDTTDTNGWNFASGSPSVVQIYGQTCTDVMNGTQVSIGYGC